jgi:hypothetical protein
MRLIKTYEFNGKVKAAKGMFSGRVIGQSVVAKITIEGEKEEFDSPMGHLFRVGGTVISMPMMEIVAGKPLSHPGYPYMVKYFEVEDSLEFEEASVSFKLKIVPWDRLEAITVKASPNSWTYRMMLKDVVLEGSAVLVKSEVATEVLVKR